MDRFNDLGRGLQLMLIGAVLLLIDTFFDWQSIDRRSGATGESAWHGVAGVILGSSHRLARVADRAPRAVDIPLPVSSATSAAFIGVPDPHLRDHQAHRSSSTPRRPGRATRRRLRGSDRGRRVDGRPRGGGSTRSGARRPASGRRRRRRPQRPLPRRNPRRRHRRRLRLLFSPEQTSAPPPGPAASGTTDAASGATSDEPSTERGT